MSTPVQLEPLALHHERVFLDSVARSHQLHARWGAAPASPEAFREVLGARNAGQHTWLLWNDARDLVGVVSLRELTRAERGAELGYYAFVPHQGHGYVSAGVAAVLQIAFAQLHLDRTFADIAPDNSASIALVQRLGFQWENHDGVSIRIDGRTVDHERWSLDRVSWQRRQRRQDDPAHVRAHQRA